LQDCRSISIFAIQFLFFMKDSLNYNRVESAIQYLSKHMKDQPTLEDIAAHVNLSPFHFQRIFTEWAGISPKKFLQFLTVEELKKELLKTKSLSEAADRVGLSAQSRVYDLFVTLEAVTPNEYRTGGKGIEIEYGVHNTPLGDCLLALTPRGICSMDFVDNNHDLLIAKLHDQWKNASIKKSKIQTKEIVDLVFNGSVKPALRLILKGTRFQVKVWEALLHIPFGAVASYQAIAEAVGEPNAAQAVGTAIGKNSIAYLIPCHRVIRSEGIIGDYRWGSTRKTALIGWERAQLESDAGI
jgi:AraC family transcriptional regulator of adaptative response/methylated-DNA-[protein]-cysteine methyltransferase